MKRLECLDGLRGLLAVYVMLSHMAPFTSLPPRVIAWFSHGGAAVDVFFMLSGLVIVRSLESHGHAARPFLRARIARLYPVYAVMLLAGIATQPLTLDFATLPWLGPDSQAHVIWQDDWPDHWIAELAAHLTMTHGLFPNLVLPDVWIRFLGAAWSLSTEWQFYLLMLVLGRSRRLPGLFLALAAAGLIWHAATPEPWHFSRAFLPAKAHFFAVGIASAAWLRRRDHGRFLGVLAVAAALSLAEGRFDKLLPLGVWLLCLAAQVRGGPGAVVLSGRAARWLGAISYPLYLANEPIQKGIGVVLAGAAHGDGALFTAAWMPLATLLPIGAAWLLHRYVEQPGIAWARQGQVMAPRAATGHRHSTRPPRTPTYQS